MPGPQSKLISCPIFEVFYGGAHGGGKTDGMLGEWIRHASDHGEHAIGIMFRRTLTQLVETIERSRMIYTPLGASYSQVDKVWRFPNGARLRFAYLERDEDADNYLGHSYTRVYIEEIGTFPTAKPILKLMGTLRSGAGVPVGFRATGNPGGPGRQWVKARYIDPAPFGWKIIKDEGGLERVFIPGKVTDNSYLGPDYIARLKASGSETLVRAWLEGDWNIVEGAFFDCWSAHIIPPFAVPKDWIRFRSGDWGSYSPFSFGWWAVVQDDFPLDGRTLPRGALVRYRECYGSSDPGGARGLKWTAEQVAERIIELEKDDPRLAYAVLDPSAFKVDGGPSIAERINKLLLGKKMAAFRKADNTRVAARGDKRGPMNGWDQMRARIIGTGAPPDNVSMFYCFSTCHALIRTLPVLQHDPAKPEDLDTESEDHAADDARYACSSRPWLRNIPEPDIPPDPYRPPDDDLDMRAVQSSVKLL